MLGSASPTAATSVPSHVELADAAGPARTAGWSGNGPRAPVRALLQQTDERRSLTSASGAIFMVPDLAGESEDDHQALVPMDVVEDAEAVAGAAPQLPRGTDRRSAQE